MPEYEYSVPMTFGGVGAAATFQVASPWNTPCEVMVHSISASAAGGVALSPDASPVVTKTATAPNSGGARGMYFYPTAAALLQPSAVFFPMPQRVLYGAWAATNATDAVAVVVIFRRAINAFTPVPDMMHVNPFDQHEWHAERERQMSDEYAAATGLEQQGRTSPGRPTKGTR